MTEMASNVISDGLQPNSHGLQPNSDDLQPDAVPRTFAHGHPMTTAGLFQVFGVTV